MIIRKLNITDIKEYKQIRLEMLKKAPKSFGSSFEEESLFEDSMWENRLTKEDINVVGAFDNGLLGVVLAVTNPRKKLKHLAHINSMFVKESSRQSGVGDKLVKAAIELLTEKGVEHVNLSVVTDNVGAIKLYERNGFTTYGTEPCGIKYNNEYIDLHLMTLKLVQNV